MSIHINHQKYSDLEPYIREYLSYDPLSGIFTWRHRSSARSQWNAQHAGKIAGTLHRGRLVVKLKSKYVLLHRLAWWMHYGVWPLSEIDHINSVPSDNRIENLREADRWQNAKNIIQRNKKSGRLKGAFTHSSYNGRWESTIVVNKKRIYLGRFGSEMEAHLAYCKAAKKYHGDFARTA